MTLTNASPSNRGRRVKFTPQAIEKIKDLVGQGASREEIANLLGVTEGSLQVTCSRLGVSLRRIILRNGSARHTLNGRGRSIPTPGAVGIAHVREQKTEEGTGRLAKIGIMMRRRGEEVSTDVPFTSRAIGELALIAILRDLSIAELVGQALAGAIKKDMIEKILRGAAPSPSV